jgi:hypothetical protein
VLRWGAFESQAGRDGVHASGAQLGARWMDVGQKKGLTPPTESVRPAILRERRGLPVCSGRLRRATLPPSSSRHPLRTQDTAGHDSVDTAGHDSVDSALSPRHHWQAGPHRLLERQVVESKSAEVSPSTTETRENFLIHASGMSKMDNPREPRPLRATAGSNVSSTKPPESPHPLQHPKGRPREFVVHEDVRPLVEIDGFGTGVGYHQYPGFTTSSLIEPCLRLFGYVTDCRAQGFNADFRREGGS